jgi:ATP-binding cassette subfamily B protein
VVKEQLHHYVVIYKVEKSKVESQSITAMDPAFGKMETYTKSFKNMDWCFGAFAPNEDFRSYNDKVSP